MLSMFAFLLVLGIVVDDAIVVGEAGFHYRQAGMPPLQAAIRGAREVGKPVVFAVLTTIVAFAPLLFVPGTIGKFFVDIPLVVIPILLISLIESLFILPAHLAMVRKARPWKGPWGALQRFQEGVSTRLERFVRRRYRPFLAQALRRRYLTLSCGLAGLIVDRGHDPLRSDAGALSAGYRERHGDGYGGAAGGRSGSRYRASGARHGSRRTCHRGGTGRR